MRFDGASRTAPSVKRRMLLAPLVADIPATLLVGNVEFLGFVRVDELPLSADLH